MIELRWALSPVTTTEPARLQWRVHQPVVEVGGTLCEGDWTEWEDVPRIIVFPELPK